MSLLDEKIEYVGNLMEEWNLSTKEKAQLLPKNPTEQDCDMVYRLKLNLAVARLHRDGQELPEEDQIAFQTEWLRANASAFLFEDKSPLEYINGDSEKLASLVGRFDY